MADLDAELLALAGGDESSADERSPSLQPKSPSPSPHSLHHRNISPEDMARKGTAKKIKKPIRRRVASDDDGEVSPVSTPRSINSTSMSESPSEGSTRAIGKDGPMFPHDKLYYSAKDKNEIDALPEIKREEILAERSSQLEMYQQNQALQRLLASRAKEGAKADAKNKRKAGAADLEENQRKSSRQRTTLGGRKAGERDETIEAYKKQRAEKGKRDEQRRRDIATRKERHGRGSPENDVSSVDAEGEDDAEWNKSKLPTPPPKDDPIADLKDIQRATIGRDNFAEVCYNPGFEKAIIGCYARVCIGESEREPGTREYRVTRIESLTKGRPYAMIAPNGRLMPVEYYVVLSHGEAKRPWSLLECSMQGITDREWRRYRITMANENINLPTKSYINGRLDAIHKLLKHQFTNDDITEKLRLQDELRAKINKTEQKEPLREKRDAALARRDYETADKIDEELRDIVPMQLAFNTSLVKKESTYVDQEQERLIELNRRNQRVNDEMVRKAQVAESRARKKTTRLLEVGKTGDDLFSGSEASRAGTPANGPSTPKMRASTPLNGSGAVGSPTNGNAANGKVSPPVKKQLYVPVTTEKKGLPVIKKAILEEDLKRQVIKDMDLDIDIDLDDL